MDVSKITSAVTGAASIPYSATVGTLRKALDSSASQSLQLIDSVAQQAGLGTNVDIRA
nr:hypothetical protein [uncultured Holophaga sp.]